MPKINPETEIREFWRVFPIQELRTSEGDDGKQTVSGYAAVFDSETVIGDWWREIIRKGAFSKTIQESDQVALWNHDDGKPLGRKSAKTLFLREDDRGLWFEIDIDDRTWAQDLWKSVKRGDVKGASFRFRVVKETWTESESDLPLRELMELKLYEVSPVTFPAYEATEIDARAVLQQAEQRGLIHKRGESAQTDFSAKTTGEPDAVHSDNAERTEPEGKNHSTAGAKKSEEMRRKIEIRENEFKQRRLKCLHY